MGTAVVASGAGIIMAIAFSGYFSGSLPLLNQLSFYIVFAVLFDTFVVRPTLVPAAMGVLGPLNWFPAGRCASVWGSGSSLFEPHPLALGPEPKQRAPPPWAVPARAVRAWRFVSSVALRILRDAAPLPDLG